MKKYTREEIAAELRHYDPETNKLGGIAYQLLRECIELRCVMRKYARHEALTTEQQAPAEAVLKD